MRYLCFETNKKIKPIWGGYTVSKKRESMTKNLTNAWIFLCYKGSAKIEINDREYLYERGSFYTVFPDTMLSTTVDSITEASDFWCHFVLPEDYFIVEADSIEEVQKPGLCVLPEFSRIDDCEKYFVVFSQFVDELLNLRTKATYKMEICDNYTKILLCSLSDAALRYNGEEKRRVSTERIFHWLGVHAKNGVTASDAAKALNYNADYLNQLVKKETGMTLTRYLNTLRILEAKNLLLNSDMMICQIASAVGFVDEKYFMKIFKSYEKVTPIQYRNAHFRKY